jgi:hypothetical protein
MILVRCPLPGTPSSTKSCITILRASPLPYEQFSPIVPPHSPNLSTRVPMSSPFELSCPVIPLGPVSSQWERAASCRRSFHSNGPTGDSVMQNCMASMTASGPSYVIRGVSPGAICILPWKPLRNLSKCGTKYPGSFLMLVISTTICLSSSDISK